MGLLMTLDYIQNHESTLSEMMFTNYREHRSVFETRANPSCSQNISEK